MDFFHQVNMSAETPLYTFQERLTTTFIGFDCFDYKILYDKLRKHRIKGVALMLVKSYRTNRVQALKIRNTHSGTEIVDQGEPQSSNPCPLFF